jgi:GNAT superfamily N-acetyltransferase
MTILYEPLTLEEIHDFWLLFKEALETQFPGYSQATITNFLTNLYTEKAYRYYLENDFKTILVAKENGIIVGFAVIDEPYGGVSLLRWLAVRKSHQRKGIGKELIGSWLSFAKTQNCHKGEVAAQPEAKEFYEKAGLELEGHRKKSYFGIDQYIFGKIIK